MVAMISLVIGTLFLRETKDADIVAGSAQEAPAKA
jgi:hypothetical protein